MDGFQIRELQDVDEGAMALAVAAGCHGIYVQNALVAGQHDGIVFSRDGVDVAVAWFGPRGNLVLLDSPATAGHEHALASRVRDARWPWRIVLGPQVWVEELRQMVTNTTLATRNQIYYLGTSATAEAGQVAEQVRSAERRDRERLARATLALNASDLNIAPSRVDRRWLYDTIDQRIADGTTRCLGPVGKLCSKLDFGSDGPGGLVLEGVFTFPEHRRKGLGSQLVAACLQAAAGDVTLHVAEHNHSARKAYERAGMRESGACRLLLLG